MKKLTLCIAIIALGNISATCQDGERMFKRFKGDVSLGYAKPTGSGSSGGVLFAMEPKFAIIDKLSVGLRIEGAVMAKLSGGYNSNGQTDVDEAKVAASYIATADFYFTDNYSIRPFIGAGGGFFALAADNTNYSDVTTATKFGGMVRAGAEVRHFRFGVEYNIIPDSDALVYNNTGNLVSTKVKNAYIGIKVGFCFGGGPLDN